MITDSRNQLTCFTSIIYEKKLINIKLLEELSSVIKYEFKFVYICVNNLLKLAQFYKHRENVSKIKYCMFISFVLL